MRPQVILVGLICTALGFASGIAYFMRPVAGANVEQTENVSAPSATTAETSSTSTPSIGTIRTSSSRPQNTPPFSWSQVESEDYKQYIANLRALGVPEQTIRDLILAEVNKLYADREAPLRAKRIILADTGENVPKDELERRRQIREIQVEKRAVIKELLGIDMPLDLMPSSGSRDYDTFETAFNIVPVEKRDAVQTLHENYWQASDILKKRHKDQNTPEYLAEQRQLNDSLRQELQKILTTSELEDFDLRTSPTAKKLATQLAATFQPSESEFRQIFRATQERDDKLARVPTARPIGRQATVEERQAATQQQKAVNKEQAAVNSQFTEQIKTSIGDQRYAEYQRALDSNFEVLTRLGIRYGLDRETVVQAYELQRNFKPVAPPGADAARGRVNPTEATRQLNEQLATILGETAARGYRRVRSSNVPATGK